MQLSYLQRQYYYSAGSGVTGSDPIAATDMVDPSRQRARVQIAIRGVLGALLLLFFGA